MLRDYLVAGVEDPRLNVQSILSRHFLARALTDEGLGALMEQECRFAAAMNWLARSGGERGRARTNWRWSCMGSSAAPPTSRASRFRISFCQTFAALPAIAGRLTVPNYVESFLAGTELAGGQARPHEPSLNTFRDLWNQALAQEAFMRHTSPVGPPSLSVLEPACGSANDYRFLDAYGLARLVDYTGFDLCAKNIENARALFPGRPL